MATICSPTNATAFFTHHLNLQFLPKTHQLSNLKKQTNRLRPTRSNKVSCKANNNNNVNNLDELKLIQNSNNAPQLLDRRDMLIGLGGMYGVAITLGGGPSTALAEPVAPDVNACTLVDTQWDASGCCPPKFESSMIRDFKFEEYPSPVRRVRRPVHKLDQDNIKDFKRAIAIMKSLPLSDPRSFLQQAKVHCAYCDGAYPVLGRPDQPLKVHGNWLFASFHRWYLYFFERIMGKLINKPEFALPFWNWDHPDGMCIPSIFTDKDSPLYDPNRNARHIDKVIDLAYGKDNNNYVYSVERQINENLLLMRKQILYPRKPSLFFGSSYPSGDEDRSNPGALEVSPHNNVHNWTGDPSMWDGQDMGTFRSAGRDPIFYCHHANVDRMWSVWQNDLPSGPRKDLKDLDYLNASFIFYDEDAKPVRVYIRDSFDTKKLGYIYEKQELPWLTIGSIPVPAKPKTSFIGPKTSTEVKFPKQLDSVIKTKVVRPEKSWTMDDEEEVLSIKLELDQMTRNFTKFDVYVNDNYDHKINEKTQIKPEFAGSFTRLPHKGGEEVGRMVGGATGGSKVGGAGVGKPRKSELRLPITMLLEEIGVSNDDDDIQVTIVPVSGTENVVITDIKIDFVA